MIKLRGRYLLEVLVRVPIVWDYELRGYKKQWNRYFRSNVFLPHVRDRVGTYTSRIRIDTPLQLRLPTDTLTMN